MSAAGSAARRALSLWSDAWIHRVRPTAAAVASSRLHVITRPRDWGAAKRSMVHSSWKKKTGVELHPLYARPGGSDCRALTAALPGSYEERLLRGLRRAARGLFGHGAQIGFESGGHAQGDDRPAARGRVEGAEAHRGLTLLDGPELIRPARGGGRQLEGRDNDHVAATVPEQPHRGRLPRGGEIRCPHRGVENGGDELARAVESGPRGVQGRAQPGLGEPGAPVAVP